MWLLDLMHSNGRRVSTNTYHRFAQLAFDDEIFPVVEALAASGYLEWREAIAPQTSEEPVPTYKLFKAISRKGSVRGTTADGTMRFKLLQTADDVAQHTTRHATEQR